MGLFVKICGLARCEDVQAVAHMQPDALGFIFWPGSPRYVEPEQVAEWTKTLPPGLLKVGVFVDDSPEEVSRVVKVARLDVAQLHGLEEPGVAAALPCRVWKVVHLDRVSVGSLAAYSVDAFLADSYSATSPGGTGQVADWSLVRDFVDQQTTPVILAGGLHPENVREAIETVRPWGVDVSSGVEAEPGRKDLEKVREFIKQCRS